MSITYISTRGGDCELMNTVEVLEDVMHLPSHQTVRLVPPVWLCRLESRGPWLLLYIYFERQCGNENLKRQDFLWLKINENELNPTMMPPAARRQSCHKFIGRRREKIPK